MNTPTCFHCKEQPLTWLLRGPEYWQFCGVEHYAAYRRYLARCITGSNQYPGKTVDDLIFNPYK